MMQRGWMSRVQNVLVISVLFVAQIMQAKKSAIMAGLPMSFSSINM